MRKSTAKKRILMPDPKFGSVLVTRFVNNLMLDGKKSTAFKVFYSALDIIDVKLEDEDALAVWEKSLENITPHVEVRSRRIGGATFQIPQPVRDDRRTSLLDLISKKLPSESIHSTPNAFSFSTKILLT